MSIKPVLYSYYRSSCSWRVRALLLYKGIDYETKAVSLVNDGGEQFRDSYMKLNPMAQVPTLIIDGHTLIQSTAIMEYLEETRPEPAMLPQDPLGRAQVRAIYECIAQGIQPFQNTTTQAKLDDDKKQEWLTFFLSNGLAAVEKILETTAGRYCVGDSVTIADCCLVPQVYSARRFQVDLTSYPIVVRVERALMELPAFKQSHPSQQPDCPENLKSEPF